MHNCIFKEHVNLWKTGWYLNNTAQQSNHSADIISFVNKEWGNEYFFAHYASSKQLNGWPPRNFCEIRKLSKKYKDFAT